MSDAPPGVQRLPLVVRPARTLAELHEVAVLRSAAYGRHRPQDGGPRPDAYDFAPNAVVLVALDRRSSRVIGTMRLVLGDTGPLELDAYVDLPRSLTGVPAEASRLAIGRTRMHTLVKLSLWKAFHRLCSGYGVDSMILAARAPLHHDYLWLDFVDPGQQPLWFVPGGNFRDPHRVLMQRMHGLQERWRSKGHDFYRFNFELVHPDIRPFVDGGVNPLSRLRAEAAAAAAAPAPAPGLAAALARAPLLGWPQELAGWAPV